MPIENITIRKLLDSVINLTGKVETMDVSVAEKVSKTLEASINAQIEARMGLFETEMKNKMAILVEEINVLKGKGDEKIPSIDGNAKAEDEDDACSNTMSWMVQRKRSSVDGLPIQRVIKKEKNDKKTMPLPVKKDELPLKKVKIEKTIAIPQLNDKSISTEGWENHLKWENTQACRHALEALASGLEEPSRRKKPQLTKTQVWPYVGNSTVKRIITRETDSKEPYDPLSKVEPEKLQKVLDFIKSDLENDLSGYGDNSAEFYLKIMLPREAWPTTKYGWLHDSHMAAAMLMFHRRSMQSESPYSSSRIAFLDRWFVKSWVNDYKMYDQPTFEWSENYIKAFNGEYPGLIMGKKWLIDVDSLFLCHHVNGDHWVALHIDLPKKVIHVYDSIPTVLTDAKMRKECMPFTKMLPTLLKKMVDPKMRSKHDKQFTCRRHKEIPKNEDAGDCGVYTLKYIECLAGGNSLDGLSDQIIPALRLKLAAEIFEEVAMVDKEV